LDPMAGLCSTGMARAAARGSASVAKAGSPSPHASLWRGNAVLSAVHFAPASTPAKSTSWPGAPQTKQPRSASRKGLKDNLARKIRVYELARELGLTNKEGLDLLISMGVGVKSHSSSIEEAQADRVRRRAEREGLKRTPPPETKAADVQAGRSGQSDPAAKPGSDRGDGQLARETRTATPLASISGRSRASAGSPGAPGVALTAPAGVLAEGLGDGAPAPQGGAQVAAAGEGTPAPVPSSTASPTRAARASAPEAAGAAGAAAALGAPTAPSPPPPGVVAARVQAQAPPLAGHGSQGAQAGLGGAGRPSGAAVDDQQGAPPLGGPEGLLQAPSQQGSSGSHARPSGAGASRAGGTGQQRPIRGPVSPITGKPIPPPPGFRRPIPPPPGRQEGARPPGAEGRSGASFSPGGGQFGDRAPRLSRSPGSGGPQRTGGPGPGERAWPTGGSAPWWPAAKPWRPGTRCHLSPAQPARGPVPRRPTRSAVAWPSGWRARWDRRRPGGRGAAERAPDAQPQGEPRGAGSPSAHDLCTVQRARAGG
jgi:translation initiation factor IF-2